MSSCSCKKDKEINANDVFLFQLRLSDTLGVERNSFGQGSDFTFEFKLTNKTNHKIFYYIEGCPDMQFQVYIGDSLFGHPHPDNYNCADILAKATLNPYETISVSIRWLEGTQNNPLPIGNYNATFKSKIALNEPKNWEDIDMKTLFSIY